MSNDTIETFKGKQIKISSTNFGSYMAVIGNCEHTMELETWVRASIEARRWIGNNA